MRTLFIGDLHLSADRPDITAAFNDFLDTQVAGADALYILGDLFEVWVGDDLAEPFALNLAAKLKTLSTTMPVYFIHGNRDFLLGKQFAKLSGMTLLPEVKTLDLYGTATVILHGDSLCTLDESYQRFRRFRNIGVAKWIYSNLPKTTRQGIADKIRAKSKQSNQAKSYAIMDVEPSAVDDLLVKTQCTRMIHGHTHRPGINALANGLERVVVGDWYEQGSVLSVTPDGLALSQLPFSH